MSHKALRRSLWMTAALVALVLGIGYVSRPADPISQHTCERIRKGMTKAEAVAVVGRDCDDLSGFPLGPLYARWHGSNGFISVMFVDDGVTDAAFVPEPLTWWNSLRKRLGW